MKLDMLYSTYQSRIYQLINNLPPFNPNVNIVIVHQVNDLAMDYLDVTNIIRNRNDVVYIRSSTKGVARSRNIAINNSRSDIVLFCDDDVVYSCDFYNNIVGQYNEYDCDFITFAISRFGVSGLGRFGCTKKRHNLMSILSVGTIEVSVRRDFLIKNNILFPENLGAGEKYYLCDEPVFLSRCIKSKGHGIYIPKIICSHPDISSGSNFSDNNALKSRQLCFKYIFGRFIGAALYTIFIVKNINKVGFRKILFALIGIYQYV